MKSSTLPTAEQAEPQPTDYAFHLPITTEADLELFLWLAFGVRIPKTQVCANHVAPWTAFCHAYFARSPICVWKGSRGLAGKTFTLSALTIAEAATLKADINILGGSGEQSKRVHEAEEKLWGYENAPRELLASEPSGQRTSLTWGNTITALMASQASVRGGHPSRLRLDEVDEMALPIFDAAMGQTMAKLDPTTGAIVIPAQTVISSTHQYPDGTMTEVLKRAAARGYPVFEWCFKETMTPHGWLVPSEVERKRYEMSEAMWLVEVELGEPSAEGRAINTQAVEEMFRSDLGTFRGGDGERIETEPPQPRARYAHGTDWAKEVDFTDIVTLRLDEPKARLVAFERMHRLDWPVMIGRLVVRVERYGGNAKHDGTGIGNVIDGFLPDEWKRGEHPQVEGMILGGGRGRHDLFSEYINAIEKREIIAPRIQSMYNEHKYVRVSDLFGGGHPPDSFVAGALAWRAAMSGVRVSTASVSAWGAATEEFTRASYWKQEA